MATDRIHKTSLRYFVSDYQEIHKKDAKGHWYVFRNGHWQNEYFPEKIPAYLGSGYSNLASARKAALKALVKDLRKFKVEAMPQGFNKANPYYDVGDEEAPLWSEGFLYPLLGKDDARSVLARLRRLDDISQAN